MTPGLPPPVRAVAGLAAWTLDEARRLPTRLVSLPVLAAGAAMQASLRLQQEYAGLVARGDELIVQLRGRNDDAPAWATFDDDAVTAPPAGTAAADTLRTEPEQRGDAGTSLLFPSNGEPSSFDLVPDTADPAETAGTSTTAPELLSADPPASSRDLLDDAVMAPVPGYDGWTVAQLRARLRRLSTEQLAQLLDYEQIGRQRAPYLTMLQNRLAASGKG